MMKYVYNAERDRLACKAWDPHFMLAIFQDVNTKEERGLMLHTCSDLKRRMEVIAEKFANQDSEILKKVTEIPRARYEKWLCGELSVEIGNQKIPASYITDYLIAEDSPSADKHYEKYGDLSRKRELLAKRDENLIQAILQSWELASAAHDIVREEPNPPHDKMHESLLE